MNLTYTRPGELRKPDVEVLPDGRIRITRYIAAGHGDRDLSEVTESVGTADKGVATARLIKRGMTQVAGKDAIVKTYEVINASSETQVGLPDVQYTQSGQKTMVYDFVQMSSGTYTPGVVGTTAAPGDANCILQTEQVEDDGTTRQIRRTFINKGLLQQTEETRNNGALTLKTFVYLNDAPIPDPPTGYTLVSQQTQNPNGLETTTYVYARGNGEVAREVSYSNSGDQGTTGITRTTIRYLVAPNAAVQPATLDGSVEVGRSFQDADGHRIWTTTWAKGIGEISRSVDYNNSDNQGATGITRTTIRYLVAPAASVQPTTLAFSALIASSFEDVDGYRVWTTVWAKGTGQISYEVRYLQSLNQGTTGATVITIRHLTSISVNSNPISIPAGTVLISEDKSDQDGYRVWTGVYAKGSGTVSSSTDIRNNSTLVVYRKTAIGTAPTAPTATIGGVVTPISESSRNDSGYVIYESTWAEGIGEISRDTRYSQSLDEGATGATIITVRHITASSVVANPIATPASTVLISVDAAEQDGYKVWTATYAKGSGTVSSSSDTRQGGKLVIYRKVALGAPATAPSATIGGIVVPVSSSSRNDSGYIIYENAWAEGFGEISRETRYVQSLNQGTTGATVITIRHLTALSVTANPITAPFGTVLISEESADQEGYRIWTAVYAKGGTGVVSSTTDTQNCGKLVIYRSSSIGAAPPTPSATIGGSVVPISQTSRTDSGYTIYDYSWAEGIGVVSERVQYRDGGLRLINRDIFLPQGSGDYSAYTPVGVEVDRGVTEGDGVRRFSVTWMQSTAGNDPTTAALVFASKVPFTYPGRAKAYYDTYGSPSYTFHKAYDVLLSPPVQALVDGTTQVTYTTANGSPSPSYTFWNPIDWAMMRAKWIGWSNTPRSKVEGLRGYIALNEGIFGFSGMSGLDTSVLGDRVYGSTDFSIILSGGPSNPAGNTLTLSIEKVPAFTSTNGVQYYRVTEVFAFIPPQPAI